MSDRSLTNMLVSIDDNDIPTTWFIFADDVKTIKQVFKSSMDEFSPARKFHDATQFNVWRAKI